MIPTNSSATTNGCNNISSNCVIWQGPDISCINLCNGDTISDIVAKLAQELCDLIEDGVTSNPNLTGLDLSCLNIPGITPTTLVPVLQAMVVQICANTSSLNGGGSGTGPGPGTLPVMDLPTCLQYTDLNGNPVTQLPLDLFATLIARKVCENVNTINGINTTLSDVQTRLDILEDCVLPCTGTTAEVQIIPTCVLPATLTNVSVVLLALETRYCALETAIGLPAAINSALNQSFIVGTTPTLNGTGTYSGLSGWNQSDTNLAKNIQNAWVVIDDMYNAIQNIQNNCCSSGSCSAVTFGYTTSNVISVSSGLITDINFNFQTSSVPAGWINTATFSQISITDGSTTVQQTNVDIINLQTDPNGYTFNVPTLNTSVNMTATVIFEVTNGTDTCNQTITTSIPGVVPCPTNVSASSITGTGVTVSFIGDPTATYKIDIIQTSTSAVAATHTTTIGSSNINQAFTGLAPNTAYTIEIEVTIGGASQTCPTTSFNTLSNSSSCTAGMDVVFLLDYGEDMDNAVSQLKIGANTGSIEGTISAQVGANDYQLALVLADRGPSSVPNYNNSNDYVALPVGDRLIQLVTNFPNSMYHYFTAMETFSPNNGTAWKDQVNKLDVSSIIPTLAFPMGDNYSLMPTDVLLGYCVETGAGDFAGLFRSGVAKVVIIITDDLPCGNNETFTAADWTRLQALETECNIRGIKLIVVGAGVNKVYSPNIFSPNIYPWREVATGTGGGWNASYNASMINSLINNLC